MGGVVGGASDGRTRVDVVRRMRRDVVLMDIRMPELDGLSAAKRVLSEPELATAGLMLTTVDLAQYLYEALRLGTGGFLLRDATAERLRDAVRVAPAGDAPAGVVGHPPDRAVRRARPHGSRARVPGALAPLTSRRD